MQAACLPMGSVAQLLREAALREEWRCGREATLLGSLSAQSLGDLLGLDSAGCTADGRLLKEQVMALTEVRSLGPRDLPKAGVGARLKRGTCGSPFM